MLPLKDMTSFQDNDLCIEYFIANVATFNKLDCVTCKLMRFPSMRFVIRFHEGNLDERFLFPFDEKIYSRNNCSILIYVRLFPNDTSRFATISINRVYRSSKERCYRFPSEKHDS